MTPARTCLEIRPHGEYEWYEQNAFRRECPGAAISTTSKETPMPDQTTTDLAQIAYQAYGDSTGWKYFLGKPMPRWEDLPESTQTAWVAAAGAVAEASR